MSNIRYLLDTNIIIGLFNSDINILAQIASNEIAIPVFTVGEPYFGAYKSSKIQQNIQRIEELVEKLNIIQSSELTGLHYGKIKSSLKAIGKPIPENDIWISALAIEKSFTLVTRDKHFENVEELKIETW
jgi:tRNA(fMet)-specific endonuclease VapC